MSEASPPPAAPQPASSPRATPARNPIERICVWGLIIVLLGVVGIEGYARLNYSMTLQRITDAMEAVEDTDHSLTLDQLKALISGNPQVTERPTSTLHGTHRVSTDYVWSGLIKSYGLTVDSAGLGDQIVVLSVVTRDAPEEEPLPMPPFDPNAEMTPPMGMAMGGGGPPGGGHGGPPGAGGGGGPPGGGGGFPQLNFEDLDTDGDGKLSLEEVPERMQENFAAIDTDEDGFISPEEFENRPRRPPGGGQGGGAAPSRGPPGHGESPAPGGGVRPEPERPTPESEEPATPAPAEESSPATSSDEAPAEPAAAEDAGAEGEGEAPPPEAETPATEEPDDSASTANRS